jgi:uncharacterized protein with NAD-binding domain and iron-sulfur cluster
MANGKVIIIGGGVAGLTAAHELAERGFDAHVYEARPAWGGKARSQPVPGTGTNGRADLPGEHGFRFYPRFYKHVVNTMARIPRPGGGTVADELRPTTESAIAMIDQDTWFRFFRRRVVKPYDIAASLELFFQDLDFAQTDVVVFAAKILEYFTSCPERRLGAYEKISWWEFLEADRYSEKFQRQLRSVPRTMVAMDPKRGSARTIGDISMQLFIDFAQTGVNNDRTLGGPTTEVWIDPWVQHVTGLGAILHPQSSVLGIDVANGAITGVRIAGSDTPITGDYYVLAVPLDIALGLISPAMGALDPSLDRLRRRDPESLVSWMTGIQFFLYEDVPLVRGHTYYPDAPWALTSISQPQFWRDRGLFRRLWGAGDVGGLISVDISDWDTPGAFVTKPAKQCTPEEISREVWEQLKAALNGATIEDHILTDELLHSWHLDDDIDYSRGLPPTNHSRLLVHPPGSWELRPEAATKIANLVIAADYVRTFTDLATMEGANEAARRAVNAILDRCGSKAPRAQLWPLVEPAQFDAAKRLDAWLYKGGHRHIFEILGIHRVAQAAELLRKLGDLTGIGKLDDKLDEYKATAVIRSITQRLGLP